MILEIFISRGGNCIKEVGFILFFRFYITLGNTSAQPYSFFSIFYGIVYRPVRSPTSYESFMIGERFGSTYDVLHTCAENFFIERFVKECFDMKIAMSGIKRVACHHIQFLILIFPSGYFYFCNYTYRSIRDDTFCTSVHWSDMRCFLSVPTFQCTRSATVEHAKYVISESFS